MGGRLISSLTASPEPGPAEPGALEGLVPPLWTLASGHGLHRLPPGPIGRALRRLTPVQRAVAAAEILGPPLALRSPGDALGPLPR